MLGVIFLMSAQGTIGSLLLVHKPKMVEIRQMKRDKFLPAEADITGGCPAWANKAADLQPGESGNSRRTRLLWLEHMGNSRLISPSEGIFKMIQLAVGQFP